MDFIEYKGRIYLIDEIEASCKGSEIKTTYLGEKEMYSDWFKLWTLPSGYYIKTKEAKNCDSIEKKLNSEGLDVYVHRHTLFDIKCYVVTERDDGCKNFYKDDLAEILNIPEEWINLSNVNDPQEYYILEDKFNEKYCNDDGIVEFKPDLKKAWEDCNIKLIKDYFANRFDISKENVFVHCCMGEFIEIKLPQKWDKYNNIDFKFSNLHNNDYVIIIKKEWL